MFGFSWHLHFHYHHHDLLCFTLRINQIPNILSLCVSSLQRWAPHLSPCECRPSPDMTLSVSPHPRSPRGARGWWWWRRCASVCPRACLGRLCHPISAQPIRGQYCDQGPIRGQYGPMSSHHSSHCDVRTQKQSAIDHKQIWPIFIFTKVSKIPEIVNKLNSYSAIIRLALVIWLGFSSPHQQREMNNVRIVWRGWHRVWKGNKLWYNINTYPTTHPNNKQRQNMCESYNSVLI